MQVNRIYNYIFFALYHFLFLIVVYQYFLKNGGDASFYWLQTNYSNNKNWIDFFNYGNDFILFLNYPFGKIARLPILFGFILYSLIGLFALVKFSELIELVLPSHKYKWVFILFLVLSPNLHFWTSILGKEPIVFLCINILLLQTLRNKLLSFSILISLFLLVMIRPHVLVILLLALFLYVFLKQPTIKQKVIVTSFFFIIGAISIKLLLNISKIYSLDYSKTVRYNDFSLKSLEKSSSYIPMIEYSYPYKLFTFFFRPLFYDIHNWLGVFLSIENMILLLFTIASLIFIIINVKKVRQNRFANTLIFLAIFGGLIFVQRYSDLGLIARTKIMLQPFLNVALCYYILMLLPNNKVEKRKTF